MKGNLSLFLEGWSNSKVGNVLKLLGKFKFLYVSKWQNNKSIKLWLKYLRGDYSLIIFWQYKCVNCTRQMLDQNRPVWPLCNFGYGIHKTDTPVLKYLAKVRDWLTAESDAETHEDLQLIRARNVHMPQVGRLVCKTFGINSAELWSAESGKSLVNWVQTGLILLKC